MSLEVVLKDEVSEVVSVLAKLLDGEDETLLEAAAAGTAEAVRSHIEKRNDTPNKLGGTRTNYWNDVAASTFYRVTAPDFTVGVDHVGAALHYYGGTVKPLQSKFLTIPADPIAHGRRAREFGNLQPVMFGRNLGALIDAEQEEFTPIFWLVPEANIRADKSILPTDNDLVAAATAAAEDALEALTQ
jgi:hypothetical protein